MSKIDQSFDKIKKKMEQQKKNAKNKNVDNDKNVNIFTNKNINKNVNVNKNKNSNKNVFILEKKAKSKKELKRQTYYLNEQLIESIDQYSNKSGYNKSELVRIALENFFSNLEIKD